MNFRNFKRQLKRSVKEAHKKGVVINPSSFGVIKDGIYSSNSNGCCLLAVQILGQKHKPTENYVSRAAETLGITKEETWKLELGFMSNTNHTKDKFFNVGFQLRKELIDEGIIKDD